MPATTNASFFQSLMLLKNRSVFGIFLGFFPYDYVWFVFITWLPGYLALERNFTPREMAIYSSVPYLPMSVIIVLAGYSAIVWFGEDAKRNEFESCSLWPVWRSVV